VWSIGAVGQQRWLITNACKSVPHLRRNPHANVRIRASELHDVNFASPTLIPIVEQCKTNAAHRNGEMLGLYPMSLPRLYPTRCNFGEVALAEPAEIRRVRPEHVQHGTPIIDDLPKLGNSNAADPRERD
jgi:hypothetical protein